MKPIEYRRLFALVKRLKRESAKYDAKSNREYRKTQCKNAQYFDESWNLAWSYQGLADGYGDAAAKLGELIRKLNESR